MELWRALVLRPLIAVLLLAGLLLVAAGDGASQQSTGPVLITPVEGAIGPPTARHIQSVIDRGAERGAALVVLEIDTPGGLVTSTRDITRAILASEVPVAVHVAPAGARAASAGTYILYAAHVAAMAPGTNLGAATPISMGGSSPLPGTGSDNEPGGGSDGERDGGSGNGETEGTAPANAAERKAVEDAVATIRSLAELRGRNADWAERAVREGVSLTANAALEENVIEHVVRDTEALIAAADGQSVTVNGVERTLQLQGAPIERVDPTLITRLLSVLANPNVALLLMTLGFYGLLYELASPGLGPGVPGAILMILGLYSLNTLPVNYAGMALILLGLLLLAAEAFSPSFGILGGGGIVAFALGAAILIDTDVEAFQLSLTFVIALSALSGLLVLLLLGAVVGTRRQAPRASSGEMTGSPAEILSWKGGKGRVRAHGEMWRAEGPADLSPGDQVLIYGSDGLTLHVIRDESVPK